MMALEIIATVRFLTLAEGGRKTPPGCGYPQMCNFTLKNEFGQRQFNDCFIELADHAHGFQHPIDHTICLGTEVRVKKKPLFPIGVRPLITVGLEFDVVEGSRVVAKGSILEIHEHDA